ncbi:MAG TPA: TonB-dependent receptor [Candidatus Binatia bacterium]|nr:TonB-dependent receptor [Candidatus Binatia bacterium]
MAKALAVLLLLLPATCGAARAPGDTVVVLPPVVVTPTRAAEDPLLVPAAVDRVDSTALARARPRLNLAESLPRIPGVLARDRQNEAQDLQISIRGFGARSTFGVRGVRLYADGIPATMPDGQGQVSHFLLDAADRIEVLRGPFSALYGNASGGVIQIFSADPPPRAEWRAGSYAGSDRLARGSFGLRGPWEGARGGYVIDGAGVSEEGFRHHSASRRTSAQALLRGGFGSGGAWRLALNGLDARADDPQGLTVNELARDRRAASPGALAFNTRKTTRQGQAGGRVEGKALGSLWSAGGYAGSRAVVQFLAVPVAAQANPLHGGGVVDLDRGYYGFDARARRQGLLGVGGLALTAGMERQVVNERRRGYENFVGSRLGVRGALRRDQEDRVGSVDEYVQAEWAPGARWRADAGARHSEIRFRSRDRYVNAQNPDDSGALEYRRTTPVAGVLWRATEAISLFANAGKGFETPTLNELAYRPDSSSGLNTALRPARSDDAEAGIRGRGAGGSYGLCGFIARTDDELVVASSLGGRTVYSNAARTLRKGVEASWVGALGSRWRATVAATWLDARFRRAFGAVAEGSRIPGIPRADGFIELRWLPCAAVDLAASVTAVDRVATNDANTSSAPGYATVDLSGEARQRIGGALVTAFVRVTNALDRATVGSVIVNEANGRYFEPAPGRGWVAGITLR